MVRQVLAHLRQPEWAKTTPAARLLLARSLQHGLRQPVPGWGTIFFAIAGYLSPVWVPLLALIPLYGIGTWKLHRLETRARVELVGAPQPLAPPDADTVADFTWINSLLVPRQGDLMAVSKMVRQPTGLSARERTELIARLQRIFSRPPSQARPDDSPINLLLLAGILNEDLARQVAAGDFVQANTLLDVIMRLPRFARDNNGAGFPYDHFSLQVTALRGLERLGPGNFPADAAQRWQPLLSEKILQAQLLVTLDSIGRESLSPPESDSEKGPVYLRAYQWLAGWPPYRARALERLLDARSNLNKDGVAAFVGHDEQIQSGNGFSSGGIQLAMLQAQVRELLRLQRLARMAIALHDAGLNLEKLEQIPNHLLTATATDPVNGLPITVVKDARGVVLRFGPRVARTDDPAKEARKGEADDFETDESDVEWWLTPEPPPLQDKQSLNKARTLTPIGNEQT